jgi:hypothetical protein
VADPTQNGKDMKINGQDVTFLGEIAQKSETMPKI